MRTIFNERMSSQEAQRVFFEYVAAHRGENIEGVKQEYKDVLKTIVRKELKSNDGYMTSNKFI